MIPGSPFPELRGVRAIPGFRGIQGFRWRDANRRANRRLLIFAAASIALHFLLTATAMVAPELFLAAPKKPTGADAPLPSLEFVVVQEKGFGQPAAPEASDKPAPEAPKAPPEKQEPPKRPEAKAEKPPEPPPPEDPEAEPEPQPPPDEPAPTPPKQAEVTAAPMPAPMPKPAPQADHAPEINLGGTDSLSSLIASGSQIIPVEVDARFRNREPVYPNEAARLGQHGLVVVQIHVAPDGHAEAVDIEKSSGHPILDRAARDAVITWHFRPAVEGGVPVPSTISVSIDFTLR